MNSLFRHTARIVVPPAVLLLAGCFGGKAQTARPDTQLRAETALTRGIRAEQKGDNLEAERLLLQSLDISTSIEDVTARTTVLINLARLYRMRHDLPNAERYIDQVFSSKENDPHFPAAEAAYEKALVELAGERPETALSWAQAAIAEDHENTLGSRLNLAARIQLVRGRLNEADVLARKAVNVNRSAGLAEEEANSLRIVGMVARNQASYDLGAQFLREALQIDKRIGRSSKVSTDLVELAEAYRGAGNLKEAAAYLERAYQVNLAGGRLRQAMENQETLSGMYATTGEEQKAAAAREAAKKLASQIESQGPGSSSATTNPSSRP